MLKTTKSKELVEEFDLIDMDEELKQSQPPLLNDSCQGTVINRKFSHYFKCKNERLGDTVALVEREYTLMKTVMPESHQMLTEFPDEEEKVKTKNTNWTELMKEKLGNFVYKMNHSGGAFSQYNKLDYKSCDKKYISLMCGHIFRASKCREEVEDVFRNIILFTYRKDFKSPLESISKKVGETKLQNSIKIFSMIIFCVDRETKSTEF